MLLTTLLGTSASLTGCAGRQPSIQKAQRLAQSYFKRYGRKYKDTVFGQHQVTAVDVHHMEEFHKHYVHADATLSLQDGGTERVRVAIEKKLPGGWRIVGWERYDRASP